MAKEKELTPAHKKLITRLNRVGGQVKAVARMIEEGEDNKKIAIQISAVSSAVQSVRTAFLKMRVLEEALENMQEFLDKIPD